MDNYMDKVRMDSSQILEHLSDYYTFPIQKEEDNKAEIADNSSYSPITPMNLENQMNKNLKPEIINPNLMKKHSSSEFWDISEGKLIDLYHNVNKYNDSKKLTEDKGAPKTENFSEVGANARAVPYHAGAQTVEFEHNERG